MNLLPKLAGMLPRSWTESLVEARWKYPWLQPVVGWGASQFKNQEGIIQKGPGKGLLFNPGASQASYLLGTSEFGVQTVMEAILKPGDAFYDVGANVGFHAVIAARIVRSAGRVVCFEPVPEIVGLLQRNVGVNSFTNVVIRGEALGAENGTARFLLSAKPTFGKLASLGTRPADPIGEIDVAIRKLDDLIPEASLPQPSVMKIDVEGAEIDVLSGAARTIDRSRPFLIVEMHNNNAAVAHWLKEAGYHGVVLGGQGAIADAYWNAAVIAAPEERQDQVAIVEELCMTPLGMK